MPHSSPPEQSAVVSHSSPGSISPSPQSPQAGSSGGKACTTLSFSHSLQRGSTSHTHSLLLPTYSHAAPMLQSVRRRAPPSILAHSQIACSSQYSRQSSGEMSSIPLLAFGAHANKTMATIKTVAIRETKYLLISNLL